MTTINNCPKRNFELMNDVIWMTDPKAFAYVREGKFICKTKKYRPISPRGNKVLIKTEDVELYGWEKLVGIVFDRRTDKGYWEGRYWYIRSYDKGLEHDCYVYGIGGKWQPTKDDPFIIVPSEAVRII